MNPYLKFVEDIEAGVNAAKGLSVSGCTPCVASTSKVLLFMPHPDDECIVGLLPLRLMREAGMQIINVPVTFGSNPERQAGRAVELADACAYLGWTIHQEHEDYQALGCEDVVSILKHYKPEVIFFPHAKDWNSRHISTHHLVVDALKQMEPDFSCTVVETEFWGAMDDPNLMVEGDAKTVADLVGAISLHVEEVSRNPYHLLLPAWMQDNVRRGGELVGGQGQAAPDFSFATLYRLRKWEEGAWQKVLDQGCTLQAGKEQLARIFSWK
ncbi:PIG-L family deacetylase [Kiritimatiellota bacterium B12222]|nr:PIG-L family deacetylase [Kiritimatiellota bacterium B12222]